MNEKFYCNFYPTNLLYISLTERKKIKNGANAKEQMEDLASLIGVDEAPSQDIEFELNRSVKTGNWERITLVDYKEHTIFATATKEATGKWIPHVTITWTSAGRQREHRLYPLVVQDKPNSDYILTTFTNPTAADHLAVQVAKTWVDEHIVKCSQKRAYVVSEQTNRPSKDLGHA